MKKYPSIERLENIMSALRDPDNGCPWDLEQDFKSLTTYSLEEIYELVEAIDLGNPELIKKELGDIFFHLMFYAQLAKEQNLFDIEDIAETISEKMINRHPHVFESGNNPSKDISELKEAWYQQKSLENKKAQSSSHKSINKSWVQSVSKALPAFIRAKKLQQQAARVGFDWSNQQDLIEKLKEEVSELSEVSNSDDQDKKADELGDILFTCVNLARHLNLDPETCLRNSNSKFINRFSALEEAYAFDHEQMANASIKELENEWQKIKKLSDIS
ncbi:MAG: nucleoside triphosphate pyrophosphohydrolase [Gammaproteobacteria bacterium]|nr:nucleoside triphosphate pyrophosphohydrolase [Gammaproteobacteria bacterium]